MWSDAIIHHSSDNSRSRIDVDGISGFWLRFDVLFFCSNFCLEKLTEIEINNTTRETEAAEWKDSMESGSRNHTRYPTGFGVLKIHVCVLAVGQVAVDFSELDIQSPLRRLWTVKYVEVEVAASMHKRTKWWIRQLQEQFDELIRVTPKTLVGQDVDFSTWSRMWYHRS